MPAEVFSSTLLGLSTLREHVLKKNLGLGKVFFSEHSRTFLS